MSTTLKQRNAQNILLSPPQWVSLVRIVSVITAFFIFHQRPVFSIALICFAESLDMLDGYLARKYNAVSAFGAIADMIIDRLTPIFGFTTLISLAPIWSAPLSMLLALDLLGHMAMLYCAILKQDICHHKTLFVGVNRLLDLYYAEKGIKRGFMVSTIIFYDLALISWLLHFIQPSLIPMPVLMALSILGSVKVYIHLQHLYYSFKLSL
jgi:phosphatidylglycerophosphate synthase